MREYLVSKRLRAYNFPTMPPSAEKKENFFSEIIKFSLIALAIVIPIRVYVAQPFIVSGASMEPTFESGEYLIIDQLTYHFEPPQYGDVVIFHYPKDPSKYFIKRIIGKPGDTILIERGIVFRYNDENPDGVEIDEPYLSDAHRSRDSFRVTLEENQYFVLGDNRAESSDSRIWGPLPAELIVGRPLIRLFPPQDAALFPGKSTAEE